MHQLVQSLPLHSLKRPKDQNQLKGNLQPVDVVAALHAKQQRDVKQQPGYYSVTTDFPEVQNSFH